MRFVSGWMLGVGGRLYRGIAHGEAREQRPRVFMPGVKSIAITRFK